MLVSRVLGDDLRAAQIRELSKADRKPGTTGCTIDTEMGQCVRDPRFRAARFERSPLWSHGTCTAATNDRGRRHQSEVGADQMIRASAAAFIDLGCGGVDQVAVGVKSPEQAVLVK